MHKKKKKHQTNQLERILTHMAKTLNELLADIAAIARGNPTDPAVIAKVNNLEAEMRANNLLDVDQQSTVDKQQVLIEALIEHLKNNPPSTIPVVSGISPVSGVSPASGSVDGGETITLTGTGFTGAKAVKFGTVDATSFSVASDTQITAVSPAQSAATINVVVTTSAGVSLAGTANEYTYL